MEQKKPLPPFDGMFPHSFRSAGLDAKRLTEWAGSIDGLAKIVVALIGVPALIFTALSNQLKPASEYLGLPAGAAPSVSLLLLIPLLWFVWRSFRQFATQSRIEKTEKFTLVATTPESLIGRDEDLQRLQQ